MRIGFFQFAPSLGDNDGNLRRVLSAVDSPKLEHCDLVVLPELALSGYNLDDRAQVRECAEDPVRSERLGALADRCSRRGLHCVIGFAESAGERVFNSSALIGPRGVEGVYRKIHLFDREKELFDPGDRSPAVFSVGDAQVGMMICFDWIFPETARSLALAGADIIAHPSNLVLSFCQDAMVTRCLENGVYAVTANRFGREDGPDGTLTFTGRSQITGPRGEVLARAEVDGEGAMVVDIDLERARDKKITGRNDRFLDRRPSLYRLT